MTNDKDSAVTEEALCRGSWTLGTACRKCSRCSATRPSYLDSQPTQSDAIVERLADALLPLAELYGGDVNMNDPLKKWLTIGHFADAKAALAALQGQSK